MIFFKKKFKKKKKNFKDPVLQITFKFFLNKEQKHNQEFQIPS
jgi:hypothetical protein